MLIDSHAHLDFPGITERLPEVLERAHKAGVEKILTIGCVGEDLSLISDIVKLTETYDGIYAALGVHPHEAQHFNEATGLELQQAMSHPRVIGWGEIGLDFHYDHADETSQRKAFRRQLELAQEIDQPVVIHSRKAANETFTFLNDFSKNKPLRGVMHCFTYDLATARSFINLGFLIGFGGILTFPRSEELREVARAVPANSYLVETDSPYLAPAPHRGKRNEPALVTHIVEKLSQIRNETASEIAIQTSSNFENLFLH